MGGGHQEHMAAMVPYEAHNFISITNCAEAHVTRDLPQHID